MGRSLLAGFIALLAAALGLEGFFYLAAPNTIARPYANRLVSTPEYRYAFRTDLRGMREPVALSAKKGLDEKRIFLIGDSFVFGTGLSDNQTLAAQCARRLNRPNIAIVNAGASGTGPLQYELALRRLAIPLGADMAVVFLFIGNDLENTHEAYAVFPYSLKNLFKRWFPHAYLWLWTRREHKPDASPGIGSRRTGYDTWDYTVLRRWARREGISEAELKRRLNRLPRRVRESAQAGRINPAIVYSGLVHTQILQDTAGLKSPGMKTAMRRVQQSLLRMQKQCKEANIPLALVLVPAGYQLNDGQEEFLNSVGFDTQKAGIQAKEPQRVLLDFCRRQKIHCLDLLPALKKTKIKPLYYTQDGHWRPPTARYAAKLLGEFLQEQFDQ